MKFIKTAAAVALLSITSMAHADFVTGTYSSTDDLTIVNGLEFLDVSVTNGISIADAVSTYAGDGFRLANYAEIIILLEAFGVDATGWDGTTDFFDIESTDAQEALIASTLGYTTGISTLGWFSHPNNSGSELQSYFCIGPGCGFGGSFLNDWPFNISTIAGSVLVRTTSVPEPGTLALFGIGLLGLGAARRRKKA